MILDQVRITVLSAPLDEPVPMSFSQLGSRDMVLVEVVSDGMVGLGESWVNYPAWASAERIATLETGVVPLLAGVDVSDPDVVQAHLRSRLAGVARQWGAPGPIWQAISAVDMALWDLLARRQGVPISQLLGSPDARAHVDAYASGIGPSDVDKYCAVAGRAGYRAVKARVGFGRDRDEETLQGVRDVLGGGVDLFVDANQAWTVTEATEFCDWSEDYHVAWLEEPIAGNRLRDLATLATSTGMTLACGENLYGAAEFERYASSGAIGLIQPDLAKSGGFTMAQKVVDHLRAGVALAPHCYGGAIVMAASLQLAAAYDVVPYIEVDARPNPLRDDVIAQRLAPDGGRFTVPSGPGLGVEMDWDATDKFIVERRECDLRGMV